MKQNEEILKEFDEKFNLQDVVIEQRNDVAWEEDIELKNEIKAFIQQKLEAKDREIERALNELLTNLARFFKKIDEFIHSKQ